MVAKPAGFLSHPNPPRPNSRPAPCAFVGPYDPETRRFETPEGPAWLLHRLDQDTSGVLAAALDEAAARRCRAAFDDGRVGKHYLALAAGLPPRRGIWRDAIAVRAGRGQVRAAVLPVGEPNAELRYRITTESRPLRLSLLEIELVTGRTHQIRVQCASRGFPLLGDDIYGDFALNRWARHELRLRRLFLHASALDLPHPDRNQCLHLQAPLPPELATVLATTGLRPAV